MNDVLATFPTTWRALLVPRRAIAIVVVAAPLVAAQLVFGGGPVEVALALALVVAFVLVGPAAWRALFPVDRPATLPVAARLGAYAALGVGLVGAIGVAGAALSASSFLTSTTSLVISCAFFLVGGFGLGRDVEMEDSLARARRRVALLQREAEHARLLAIKNHLDPHFVFNTLNAIAEWCRDDAEVAERAILQLSSILRAVLAGVQRSEWPLADERALLDALASLHRLRDPGRFDVEVRVDDGVDAARLPPLLLLPVVENAIKHGPAAGHRGVVTTSFTRDGDALVVVVENPGPYAGPRPGGEGVPMVERRVALASDGRGSFDLAQIDVDGALRTRATLRLPGAFA